MDSCGFKGDHPQIERRLSALEEWKEMIDQSRLADYKDIVAQVGAVHEKVNAVAIRLEGLNGKLIVYGLITTGGGALMMFLINSLFNHVSK